VTLQKTMDGRLAQLVATNGLTGLANRRRFDEALTAEWRRAAREGTWLSLLLLRDLDRFREFNKHYGHAAGDDALRTLREVLEATIHRPGDLACRYGGDKFAVILPDTDPLGARDVAERVPLSICATGIRHGAIPALGVTVSIGLVGVQPQAVDLPELRLLLAAADTATPAAEQAGGNQVVAAPPSAGGTAPAASGRSRSSGLRPLSRRCTS
jgi:diguanylate cyclase (GGDEF)-like protein